MGDMLSVADALRNIIEAVGEYEDAVHEYIQRQDEDSLAELHEAKEELDQYVKHAREVL